MSDTEKNFNAEMDTNSDNLPPEANTTAEDDIAMTAEADADDETFLEKKKSVQTSEEDNIPDEEVEEKESVLETELVSEEETTPQEEVKATDEETLNKIASLEAEIITLKTNLEKQQEITKETQSQYMRLNADFENFRRRTAREKEELEFVIKKKVITELLPTVDNFERARSQIKPSTEGETAIQKSYQGVYKNLVEGLKKSGVSAMRPEGELFDPNYHEAMLREATNDHPEGTIIEQLVRGYMLDDQVLRYAMVKVAVPKEDEAETPENM